MADSVWAKRDWVIRGLRWIIGGACVAQLVSTPLSPILAQQPGSSGAATAATNGPTVRSGDVELSHSHVYIRVDKARVGHEHAVMGRLKSGQLRLAAAENPQIEPGALIFDMTSFDADSDTARQYIGMKDSIDANTRKQVNDNMLGKEILDVRRFPTATFVAKKIVKQSATSQRGLPQYEIEGDLTLHGTTRPVKFTVDVEEVKGWYRLRGAFAILQTNFGIKPFTKMFGTIGVADKLDIYGDLIVAP